MFELLDTRQGVWRGKRDVRASKGKIRAAGLEIFHSEAERISLPPHVSAHKQLRHCPLVFICLMVWLALMKPQEYIIITADTLVVGILKIDSEYGMASAPTK